MKLKIFLKLSFFYKNHNFFMSVKMNHAIFMMR